MSDDDVVAALLHVIEELREDIARLESENRALLARNFTLRNENAYG